MIITLSFSSVEVMRAFAAKKAPIASAATQAMKEVGGLAKQLGRAAIAKGGFGPKWQNALRANTYPRGRDSIDAATFIFHKIDYAHVFERGAHIQGSPLLWLPMRFTPKKAGRDKMTPARFSAKFSPLVPFKSNGRIYLGASVALNDKAKVTKITPTLLRKGHKKGTTRLIPMFIGVRSVTIGKKFSVIAACKKAADEIASKYFANLRV